MLLRHFTRFGFKIKSENFLQTFTKCFFRFTIKGEMSAIILFDGVCNFCSGAVNFIINRDRRGYFKFAPLQSKIGEKLLAEHKIDKAAADSVILFENGKIYTHSSAALRIARKLDGAWRLLYGFVAVPPFIRDFIYKLFAKNRYRMFGRQDACMMPTPEIRARFLATN